MLWIFTSVGAIGALIMFVLIIDEMFSSIWNWGKIKTCAIRLVILSVIGMVSFWGIDRINTMTYKETVKTGEWQTVSLKDNRELSVVEYTTYTKHKMNKVLRALLTSDFEESATTKSFEISDSTGTIHRIFF